MSVVRALALFCEDIREEKTGQDILIGIMGDNLALPSIPSVLTKLSVYVRVSLDTTAKADVVSGRLNMPWGQEFDLGQADPPLVEKALREARNNGNPLAGLILKGTFAPLPVPELGKIIARVKIGKRETICGVLNVVLQNSTTAANV